MTDPRWQPDRRPTRIDYRAPQRTGINPELAVLLKIMGGFGLGVAASILVWYLGLRPRGSDAFSVAYAVLGIKVAAAVVLLFIPNWRSAASGLLLSIGVGTLIFLVTCGGS
jgi:hypothetical protein